MKHPRSEEVFIDTSAFYAVLDADDEVHAQARMGWTGLIRGKELIARLSNKLKASGLKGCSPTNLCKFREFYQGYPEIQQTLSVNSVLLPTGIAPTVPMQEKSG